LIRTTRPAVVGPTDALAEKVRKRFEAYAKGATYP
jgi:hypothetical protein